MKEMLEMGTEVNLSSSHFLPDYNGKCRQQHGHNWKVEIKIRGFPHVETGMLIDFNDLKTIMSQYDHCDLNEHLSNPTCERLVEFLLQELSEYINSENIKEIELKISETEKNYVSGRMLL